jgi:small subunit ribosomal protein S8
MTDPIADLLTRIRNGIMARHRVVDCPASNIKKDIVKILFEKGYILNYKFEEADVAQGRPQGNIKIALKYNPETKLPAIKSIQRVSRPGLRKYVGHADLPRVLNGLGVAIISTSHGVMPDKEARARNIGGEVMCYVY